MEYDNAMFVCGYIYRCAEEIKEDGSFPDLTTMELARLLLRDVLRERSKKK